MPTFDLDWVERLFHVSPDGGSGWFELLIYCILAALLALLTARPARTMLMNIRRRTAKYLATSQTRETSALPQDGVHNAS
jgi:hypothetical protein